MPEAAAAEVVAPEVGALFSGLTAEGATAAGAEIAAGGTAAGALSTSLPSLGTVGTAIKDVATVAGPAASVISAGSSINAAKSLKTGGSVLGTSSPTIFPPSTMPVFGDASTLTATRKSLAEQVMRRGRASTVLTSPSGDGDKLGA